MRQMKDSGIQWIGAIPAGWETKKIKSFYSQRIERVSDKEYPPLSVTMKGILPQLSTAAKTDDGDNRKLVKQGDFAINSRSDRRGSCGISRYCGSVSLINIVLKPYSSTNAKYYDWLFHSIMFSDEFYRWGHGIVDDLWTTNWQDMKNICVPLPPLPEQQRIAAYLDAKCGEIDRAMSRTRESIAEYKKLKQSIITEAVTNLEWEVMMAFQLFFEVDTPNIGLKESNLLSLSYGKIVRKDIETKFGLLPESFETYNIVEKDDIVLRLTDLQNDQRSLRVGMCEERGIVTSAYVSLRNKSNNLSRYLYYFLHSFDVSKGFYGMGAGVRQGLNWNGLKHLEIPVPPLLDQRRIVAYLDQKCSEIDELVAKKERLIEELEKYKKSLIYECVTGKREVE